MVEGFSYLQGNTLISRGGAAEARRAHNPKVVGSNPTPATNAKARRQDVNSSCLFVSTESQFHSVHKLFTRDLLSAFLKSRANGLSPRIIADYEWRLNRFIGYPLTTDGINSFPDNLSCANGKWNYFKCIRVLGNL